MNDEQKEQAAETESGALTGEGKAEEASAGPAGENAELREPALRPAPAAGKDEGAPAAPEEHPDSAHKRTKRASRKELLELVHRKNTLLQDYEKRVTKAEQELKNREDRFLRLAAEFENYKKRSRREWELLQKQANADLIREIVGGIDNFDRAFMNLGEEGSQLHEGIKLIHAGLVDVLKRAGLAEIEALGQRFDPQYHEAIGEIESEIEEGHVAEVIQRGYTLNGQVLRPARVIVSRKKASSG